MLVLSRETNEMICIGEDIYIKVLTIHGGKVRLGIEATKDIPIRRAELPSPSCTEVQEDLSLESSLETIT